MFQCIHPGRQKQVANLLKWLTFSFRPLLLDELAEIFILNYEHSVPFDESKRLFKPEDLLKYLHGIVVTVPSTYLVRRFESALIIMASRLEDMLLR
jgi:hypothetical protein